MAFDFPNSPTVGQSFTPIAGTTYIWNGYGWDLQAIPAGPTGPAGGPTGPTGPSPGSTGPTGPAGFVDAPTDGLLYGRKSALWSPLSGSRVLIQAQTVTSAVAQVDFITGINATYDQYEIDYYNVKPTVVDQHLFFRVSQDGGATFTTAASYQWGGFYVGGVGSPAWWQSTGQTYMPAGFANNAAAPSGAGAIDGTIKFSKPDLAQYCLFRVDAVVQSTSYSFTRWSGVCGFGGNSNAIQGIRFLYGSGNIAQGTFRLYGIHK